MGVQGMRAGIWGEGFCFFLKLQVICDLFLCRFPGFFPCSLTFLLIFIWYDERGSI